MEKKIIRTIHPEVRIVDSSRGIVDYVASDETLDSYREIIRADGWKFTNFRKNAPFVDSHDYSCIDKQLGRVIDFRVEGKRLIERVQWAVDVKENTLAQLGWKMTEAGYLKAVSVGFFPTRAVSKFDQDQKLWREQLKELGLKDDSTVRTIYVEQEQIELSSCIIGANPNALAKAVARGVVSRSDVEELLPGVLARANASTTSTVYSSPFRDHAQKAIGRLLGFPSENPLASNVMHDKDTIDRIEIKQDEMFSDFSCFQRETKAAFEALTRSKNHGGSESDTARALAGVVTALNREKRLAFGDPVRRIVANEHWRAQLNAVVRKLVGRNYDQRALGETTSPGSTLIDDKLSEEIYSTLAAYGKWNTLGVVEMGSKQEKFPIKTTRAVAQFYFADGTVLPDDANKAGTSVTAQAELIAVLLNVSKQAMDDNVDVAADVIECLIEAVNFRLDNAAFVGNGVADGNNGGMTGLFNFGTAAVAANGGTTAQGLDMEDFIKCFTTVDSGVLARPCAWWVHPVILARFVGIKDAAGSPLFSTALEAPTGPFMIGSILGYPVHMVDAAPSTNGAAQKVAAFGDPRAMAVGIRREVGFEASDKSRWNTYEVQCLGTARAGVKGRRAQGIALLTTSAV